MSWKITAKQYIPAAIGEPFGGGYFAGYISHTADGNPTHALIVAPAATGATGTGYTQTTMLQWKNQRTNTAGTDSVFNGVANTAAMVAAGINNHPAAKFCTELTIGGFTDWYLPAIRELDIAYFNLKRSTGENNAGSTFGINTYSVPVRSKNYSKNFPVQTRIAAFKTTAERFELSHWSSTENSNSNAWVINMTAANVNADNKTSTFCVRAFRRIAL